MFMCFNLQSLRVDATYYVIQFYETPCVCHALAYHPFWLNNSECVPDSSTVPLFNTTILSASEILANLCATITIVVFFSLRILLSTRLNASSDSASKLLVGSSRIRIDVFFY